MINIGCKGLNCKACFWEKLKVMDAKSVNAQLPKEFVGKI